VPANDRIQFNIDKRIAWLRINRPEAANAYTDAMVVTMEQALDAIEKSTDARVLVVTSAVPGRFCAGADLSEIRDRRAVDGATIPSLALFDRLESLPIPTLAAIDGPAIAGGLELALACDLRIATRRSRFGLPETGLGILPAAGATWRLPRVVGQQHARAMILFGQEWNAEQALAAGLIAEVVADNQLLDRVETLALKVIQRDQLATTLARNALNATLDGSDGRDIVTDAQCRLYERQERERDD
jgi:enoyl-CoA hydratase